MRWDAVLKAMVDRAAADSALSGIYGDAIRKQGTHPFTVPSLDYSLVTIGQSEIWEPHIIQFSQWTKSLNDSAVSDRRLRRLFDHDNMVVIEGVTMWSVYEDGGDLTGPETEGYYGLAARYRLTPIREKLLLGRSS